MSGRLGGVGRHWGASTKLGVGGPTSLIIHLCRPQCRTPHVCLSLILTTTPKAGKKLDNLPKVMQTEDGRARVGSQVSQAPESALNQWNTKMWSPHTWSLQTDGEKSEGYATSGVRNTSEGWGTGGIWECRSEKPYKGQRWNLNPVLSRPKVFGLCTVVGCLPKLQEAGKAEEAPTERTVTSQVQTCPLSFSRLPRYHLGSRKRHRRSQRHLQAIDICMIPRDVQPRDV